MTATALLLAPGAPPPGYPLATGPAQPPQPRPRPRELPRRVGRAALHNLGNLPVAIAFFVVASAGVAAAIGGFPPGLLGLLAVTLLLRRAGGLERERARRLLGLAVDDPPPLSRDGRLVHRVKALATDDGTWRAFAYAWGLLPWAIFTCTVTITLWASGLGVLTSPVWRGPLSEDFGGPVRWAPPGPLGAVLLLLVGLAMVALAATVTLLLARGSACLVQALLGPSGAQRDHRVAELTTSRRRVVDVASTERRRIERDLHDGAQQRLVGLALTLGRAERDFDEGDVGGARALVTQARGEAREVLAELRDLVRGISPAVLSDRGLDAALSAVTARSALPVLLDVDPVVTLRRPEAAVEEAAYFVVTEALTNATKHAGAGTLAVDVHRIGALLVVSVNDDGRGGAVIRPGGGLAGLLDRVEALDGTLVVASPPGGPTRVTATLPG